MNVWNAFNFGKILKIFHVPTAIRLDDRNNNQIYEICPRKSPAIVNITRIVCMTLMSPGAKESGLECACVNNDHLTVLVSWGGRHH